MKASIITTLLAAATLFSGCSKDTPDGGLQSSSGNRVVFTLGGSTRASGSNDEARPMAAKDEEKKIESLLAVVFQTSGGAYYKTYEAQYQSSDHSASFDLEKSGDYTVWFVANADAGLKAKVMTLTDQTSDSSVKAEDLQALLATQAVGKQDGGATYHPFLMLSTDGVRVVSKAGVVTNGGVVTMRRLAVRIDIVNAATGVTVNSVKFVNRTKQSRLGASNDMNFSSTGDLYETKEYASVNLAGDFERPTEYAAEIYSYEHVTTDKSGGNLPSLEIKYTMDGLQFTHTVEFFDSKSTDKRLALKRNHLYRVVLTKQLDVTFDIIVEDWNTAEAFTIEDLPFHKHDQAALNAKLKVNMFTEFNAKSLTKSGDTPDETWKVSFFDKLTVKAEECPQTSYFSYKWLSGADADGATSANGANTTDLRTMVFVDDAGKKYRMPTGGECTLLIPRPSSESAAKGTLLHPYWNDNPETNTDGRSMKAEEFTETVYLENSEEFKPNATGASIVGQSQLKLGKAQTDGAFYETGSGTGHYNIRPVYGIRFKGTSEYAAYRWEYCRIGGSETERYLSIKIKALPEDSKLTVDDIADNVTFWKSGCIEFKFPASGFYDSKPEDANIISRGYEGYAFSSTLHESMPERGLQLGWNAANIHTDSSLITYCYALRLVKVSE